MSIERAVTVSEAFTETGEPRQYVQTVLFQIAAERLDEFTQAGGLLSVLEGHKALLQQYDGFAGMWILKSINQSGPVQVMVQTRWLDEASLADYEAGGFTLESLLQGYTDLILADTLQVYDMHALM